MCQLISLGWQSYARIAPHKRVYVGELFNLGR